MRKYTVVHIPVYTNGLSYGDSQEHYGNVYYSLHDAIEEIRLNGFDIDEWGNYRLTNKFLDSMVEKGELDMYEDDYGWLTLNLPHDSDFFVTPEYASAKIVTRELN